MKNHEQIVSFRSLSGTSVIILFVEPSAPDSTLLSSKPNFWLAWRMILVNSRAS